MNQESDKELLTPLGVEGAKISNGFVHEEFLPKLTGSRGRKIYREMRDNDDTVSATLFAVEMLLRAVKWSVEPADQSNEALEAASFVEGALFEDMSHTWDEFIGNVLTMLPFGWQYTEVVFKRRNGQQEDSTQNSKFSDGRIGIRKLADRSQETLDHWEISEDGGVSGMWQLPPNGGSLKYIPINRALLFRPHPHKGSPEGRSVLRGAYRSWYFLKNIQEIEAIAIERELNGLPVVYIPNKILVGKDDDSKAAVQKYIKMVRDIKFNEQGGAVLPSDPFYNSQGEPTNVRQVELSLLSASGSRAIDTDKVIKRYQASIARTILADFIILGMSDKGSFALSKSKVELFAQALEGWLGSIASVINRHLIRRLWSLNNFDYRHMPTVVPGKVAPVDLAELGDFISKLAGAGATLFPDDDLENNLRGVAGLPAKAVSDMMPAPIPDLGEDIE